MINLKNKTTTKINTGGVCINNGVTSIYNESEFVNISTNTVPIVSFEKGLEKYNLTEKELLEMLQKYHPEKLI